RNGAKVIFSCNVLTHIAVEVMKIGCSDFPGAVAFYVLVHHRNWRLCKNAYWRYDNLDLVRVELVQGEQCLVLPGQQHVANSAFDECNGRPARAGIQDGHPLEQLSYEFSGGRLVAVCFLQRVAPGRQIIPAGTTRSLWIRGDDRDVVLEQVFPVRDLLGIPFSDEEHDGRSVWSAVVFKTRLPVFGYQATLGDRVDVRCKGQRHDIGGNAVNDCSGLFARPAV